MMAPRSESPATVVLALVVVMVATGLLVDGTLGPVAPPELQTTAARLLAGSTTCAAAALDVSSEITVTTVAAPDEDATGTGTATAQLELHDDGSTRSLARPDTSGRAIATAVAGGSDEVALAARWDGTPLLLSRRWSIDSTDRVPGTVEGPCPGEPSAQWFVPGVTTAGGGSGELHLANPTEAPASLAVTFTTADGPVSPTRLANITVAAHGRTTVDLNEFVPEEPDLGVVVSARAGKVVAEVLQTLEAAVGGVDGRSLVVAHRAPREQWTMPWVAAGDGETAWVWVTNPGEEPTDVRLVLHTPDGPVVPPASGVTLAPGTTARIDLRGALGELGPVGVTVRSAPGVPVVASAAVLRVVEDDPVRSGVAVVEGMPAVGGRHAALSAVGSSGLERQLALTNPGEEDAVVDVTVVGRNAQNPRVVASALLVPAGTSVQVELADALPEEGGFAVALNVTEGTLTGAVVTRALEGPLDLGVMAARPFPTTVTVTDRSVQRDRTLLHPIRRDELLDAGS